MPEILANTLPAAETLSALHSPVWLPRRSQVAAALVAVSSAVMVRCSLSVTALVTAVVSGLAACVVQAAATLAPLIAVTAVAATTTVHARDLGVLALMMIVLFENRCTGC